jgi:Mrp family chromosome partitioning ATPase
VHRPARVVVAHEEFVMKVVTVINANGGCGKSTIAMNLAVRAAEGRLGRAVRSLTTLKRSVQFRPTLIT